MLEIGKFRARINQNNIGCTGNGTAFVNLTLEVGDDVIDCPIWLTHKSMKMAKLQLKKCGFDIDKYGLDALNSDKRLLDGHEVDIEIIESEYNGRTSLKAQIVLGNTLDAPALEKLTQELRSIKEKKPKKEEEPIEDDDMPF